MPSYCDINTISNIDVAESAIKKTCKTYPTQICQPTFNKQTNKASTSCLINTDCLPNEQACYYSYMLGKSREKLDSDLQEIHRPETSHAYTFQSNLETTMLTGIVWAMLGTTVLYYAFTKI